MFSIDSFYPIKMVFYLSISGLDKEVDKKILENHFKKYTPSKIKIAFRTNKSGETFSLG